MATAEYVTVLNFWVCGLSRSFISALLDGDLDKNREKYSSLKSDDWRENAEGDVPPIGAIVGGVLGQEGIKAIGLKEEPIENWFLFNGENMTGNTIKLWLQ